MKSTKTLDYFGVVSFIIPAQYMLVHTLFLQAAKALVSLRICTDLHGPKLLDNVMNTCACPCVFCWSKHYFRVYTIAL